MAGRHRLLDSQHVQQLDGFLSSKEASKR